MKFAFLMCLVSAAVAADEPTLALWLEKDVGVTERPGAALPLELKWTDADGAVAPLSSLLKGRPLLIVPVDYGCSTLCSSLLRGVAGSLETAGLVAGRDLDVVVYSVDVDDDTRDALREAREAGVTGWRFLVADASTVAAMNEALGLRVSRDAALSQVVQPVVSVFATPAGHLSRYAYGVRLAREHLVEAVAEAHVSKAGASFGRPGLNCFRWDPAGRRFRTAVSWSAGALAAGALLLALALWRPRRRSAG